MRPSVLDTSALLAFFKREPGMEVVWEVLGGQDAGQVVHEVSRRVYVPFIALMEFEYQVQRRYGPNGTERALGTIDAWPVEVPESDPEWRREAARLKTRAGLSVADAWIAALALRLDAELVHKDPEFDRVEGLRHLRLPYK